MNLPAPIILALLLLNSISLLAQRAESSSAHLLPMSTNPRYLSAEASHMTCFLIDISSSINEQMVDHSAQSFVCNNLDRSCIMGELYPMSCVVTDRLMSAFSKNISSLKL